MSSAVIGTLAVRLSALTAEFNRDMEKSTKKVSSFSDTAARVSKIAGAAFAGMSGALGVLTKFASEQLKVERQLSTAFRATGQSLDMGAFQGFAASLQAVTTTGDEVVLGMGAMMASMGLGQRSIQALLPGVLDLAAATGTAADSIAQRLAVAVETGQADLKKLGITMSEAEKEAFELGSEAERTAILVGKLASFQGMAAAEASTAAGRFNQLTNSLGDVLEETGKWIDAPLAGTLNAVRGAVDSVVGALSQLSPETKETAGRIALLVTAAAGLTSALAGIVAFRAPILGFIASLGTAFKLLALKIAPVVALLAGVVGSVRLLLELKESGIEGLKERLFAEGKIGADSGFGATFGALFKDTMSKGVMADLVSDLFADADAQAGDFAETLEKATAAASRFASRGGGGKSAAAGFDFGGKVTPEIQAVGDQLSASGSGFDFGGEVTADIQAAGDALSEALGGTAEMVAEEGKSASAVLRDAALSMLSNAGDVGDIAGSAVQGFQQGGPIGAIIAVFADLVSRSEAFKSTVAHGNEAIAELVKAFEPLAENSRPLAILVHKIVGIVGDQLSPVFEALEPVFNTLFSIIRGILIGVLNVVMGLGAAWNAIVGFVEDVINFFGADVDFGAAQINLNGINRAIADLHQTTVTSAHAEAEAARQRDLAGQEVGRTAEAFRDLNEQMSNTPSGFKIDLRRFQSVAGETLSPEASPSGGGVTYNWYIEATDVEDFHRKLQRHEGFRRMTGGSQVPRRTPFGVPRKGG